MTTDHASTSSLPLAEKAYLSLLVSELQERLGARLVGVYLFGSAAYGDYVPGRSDLDVQAVVAVSLAVGDRRALAEALSQRTLPCPARRLEFVLYPAAAVNPAQRRPRFQLNFNTGPTAPDHLTLDPAEEASHWFLLDIAIGRRLGRALFGPSPGQVFAAIPRAWQLGAILESLAWHEAHEVTSANSVLNACRGWRYAVADTWGSKVDGATWALEQPACPTVVRDALERQDLARFEAGQVAALIETVRQAVENAAYSYPT